MERGPVLARCGVHKNYLFWVRHRGGMKRKALRYLGCFATILFSFIMIDEISFLNLFLSHKSQTVCTQEGVYLL